MRLVLDITRTRDGRYEGRVVIPGTASQHDFAGILELLAILEEQLQPADKDTHPGRHEGGTGGRA